MKKVIGLIATVAILAFGALAVVAWPEADFSERVAAVAVPDVPGCPVSDIFDPEPMGVTWDVEVAAKEVFKNPLSEEEMRIVGRLAEGIVKYKAGQWWECGKLMTDENEIGDRAVFYAYEIVRAANEVSDHDDDPEFVLNPWGLAGVIRNESQFDRCALGTHPRKTAYRLGLLEKQRRCISHTEEDILRVVQSEDMNAYYKRTGFDLGTAQLLSRFYSNPRDFKTMVSVRGSTTEAAYHMRKRGRIYKTKRPWLYWRGYRCEWYDDKISRWARQLGAKPGEI